MQSKINSFNYDLLFLKNFPEFSENQPSANKKKPPASQTALLIKQIQVPNFSSFVI